MPAFRLRPATTGDEDCLRRLAHEGLRPHVEPLEGWDQAHHDRGFHAVFDPASVEVIECDGAIAGYRQLHTASDHLLLAGLYVAAGWRGRGLGGAVLADTCRQADRAGLPLRLRVHRGNPARRLYLRHGFVDTAVTATRHLMTRPVTRRAGPEAR
ncbi:MAG: GNAT family N-acetyltransferase [Planctomycetes bacterium]|nr:GNAT family N-acetyltransferase [Planctomycetota bacterium]